MKMIGNGVLEPHRHIELPYSAIHLSMLFLFKYK